MALASSDTNLKRFIEPHGPVQIEYINFTLNSIGASDTSLTSRLSAPRVAIVEFSGDQADAHTIAAIVVDNDTSSSTYKQITLTDFDDIGIDLIATIRVFGH